MKCKSCEWEPCICDRLFGDEPKKSEPPIDGVAYDTQEPWEWKYHFKYTGRLGDTKICASNNMRKIKEAAKAMKLQHVCIEGDEWFVRKNRDGSQQLVMFYSYTPRYY